MDPVTHIALGSSLAVVLSGPRASAPRAALLGAVLAVLPDLDVLVDHGDPVANMILHRGWTHAWSVQAVAALLLAWPLRRHWLAAASPWRIAAVAFAVLATHSLCDAMNTYGTRLWLPFDATPVSFGSLFVIDPLVTVPMLLGAGIALWRGDRRGRLAAWLGLAWAVAYALLSLGVQQHVAGHARAALQQQGVVWQRLLVTPAPLQTLLWRVVATDGARAHEAFVSLLDPPGPIAFTAIDLGPEHLQQLAVVPAVAQLQAFSGGWLKAWRDRDGVRVADLRMGQEPHYAFTFVVAAGEPPVALPVPAPVPRQFDLRRGLGWLWPRMWGEPLPPPR